MRSHRYAPFRTQNGSCGCNAGVQIEHLLTVRSRIAERCFESNLRTETLRSAMGDLNPWCPCSSRMERAGKVGFGTGTDRKAFFDFFFGLILDPPGTYAPTAKKRQFHWYWPFFPHCVAFFGKGEGGLVLVYVLLLPEGGSFFNLKLELVCLQLRSTITCT